MMKAMKIRTNDFNFKEIIEEIPELKLNDDLRKKPRQASIAF